MNTRAICERIGGSWTERSFGFWKRAAPEVIRPAALVLRAVGARLSSIVACEEPGGGARLSWHWDLEGTLFSIEATIAAGAEAPSLVDIYPGADWAERETYDYYAVMFEGRGATPSLVLARGDSPGILKGLSCADERSDKKCPT